MMNWKDATQRYLETTQLKWEMQQIAQLGQPPLYGQADVLQATWELEQFLGSDDGRAALNLLAASGRRINFGEEIECFRSCVVYFIDGTGLKKSFEASRMWKSFNKDTPKSQITPATAHEAVVVTIHSGMGPKKPNEVMNWLRSQLDAIASQAPETVAK